MSKGDTEEGNLAWNIKKKLPRVKIPDLSLEERVHFRKQERKDVVRREGGSCHVSKMPESKAE